MNPVAPVSATFIAGQPPVLIVRAAHRPGEPAGRCRPERRRRLRCLNLFVQVNAMPRRLEQSSQPVPHRPSPPRYIAAADRDPTYWRAARHLAVQVILIWRVAVKMPGQTALVANLVSQLIDRK